MSSQYFKGKYSQLTSKACVIDTSTPTFAGISTAVFQNDGSALVSWLVATSTKAPVRYEVFVAAGSVTAAVLFLTANRVAIAPSALLSLRIFTLRDQVTYFAPGQQYTFGVRAVDSQNYTDTNVVVVTQTAVYPNYGSLASSVWDQLKSAHTIAGSFGFFLDAQVSLSQTAAAAVTQYNALVAALATLQTSATALSQYNTLTTAIGLVQTAATALSQYNSLVSGISTAIGGISAIPTNPLLTNDSRLSNLDVAVSSRQPTATALSQYNAIQSGLALLQTAATALTQFNTLVSDIGAITQPDNTDILAIKAKTDQLLFDADTGVKAHTLNTTNVNVQQIVDGVWNEPVSDHTTAGTFGENAQTPSINPAQVADAVWDAQITDHDASGTFGKNAQTAAIDPTGVADAVWDALASLYNTSGSMGALLNSTGSPSSTVGVKVLKGQLIEPNILNGTIIQPNILRGKVYS